MSERPDNVVEVSAEVAGQVVKGLGTNPLLLGLVVLVAIGAVANYLFVDHLLTKAHERSMIILENCFDRGEKRDRSSSLGEHQLPPLL